MIIVITGPTCLGKSETAIKVAKNFNAEIVNGDAFQSYKELNIGVAKPSVEMLNELPHHLYSFVSIKDSYSIKEYQSYLRNSVEEILSRGKNVVIVGGSGLYIRSALYDYKFAEEVKSVNKYDKLSNEELYQKLVSIDENEAKKLHPNNRKRVLRAINIFELENKQKSTIIAEQKHELIYEDTYFFVRDMERDELYRRINLRVDKMFKIGLLNEVKQLYNDYDYSLQALQAIGYKELKDVIDGLLPLEKGIELIKQHTRNYAKRQMTFIRHQFPTKFYKNDDELIGMINKIIKGDN